jgi:hypothetical protein
MGTGKKMNAVAVKTLEKNDSLKKATRSKQAQTNRLAILPKLSSPMTLLQKKSICPCDGGCPNCSGDIQTKHIGDQITPLIQRQVDEPEEEEPVQEKPLSNKSPPGPGVFTQHQYDKWLRKHPKFTDNIEGSWQGEYWCYKIKKGMYTLKWFLDRSYFYAGQEHGGYQGAYIEVWLSNKGKGKRYRLFRGPDATCDVPPDKKIRKKEEPAAENSSLKKTQPEQPVSDPQYIDIPVNPEKTYGPIIESRDNAQIFGQSGYAVLYSNGTIEFYMEGSSEIYIYIPRSSGSGYTIYEGLPGEKGKQSVIWLNNNIGFP